MAKKVGDSITNSANEAKKETVRKQLKDAGLPDSWLGRVDLASETSIEDSKSRRFPKSLPESSKRRSMMPWPVVITLPVP